MTIYNHHTPYKNLIQFFGGIITLHLTLICTKPVLKSRFKL